MPQIKTLRSSKSRGGRWKGGGVALENEIAAAVARNVANFWNSPIISPGQCHELKVPADVTPETSRLISLYLVLEK